MSMLPILKKIFKNQTENKPCGEGIVSNEANQQSTADIVGIHDLMIVAGNKTLILISDKRRVGLWMSDGVYDPCSATAAEGHNQINQLIHENLDELYDSLIYPLEENLFFLNITDSTNRGNLSGEGWIMLCHEMLDVFFPIIYRFVEENAINKKVGVIVFPNDRGTSIGADYLCDLLSAQHFNVHVHLEDLTDSLVWRNENCIQDIKNRLLHNYNVTIHKDAHLYEERELSSYPSICLELRNNLIKLAKEHNQNIPNKTLEKEPVDRKAPVPFPSISRSAEMRLSQYGQVRTLADIVKYLNCEKQYTDIYTLLNDLGNTINKYIQRGTICEEAYWYLTTILRIKSDMLFESSSLNLDKLIELVDDNRETYGFTLDDIYSKRSKTQLLKLVNLLNEIKHYTHSQDLISDLDSIMPQAHSMSKTFGRYPLYFFEQGIKSLWNEITPNGYLDSGLLEKYMFTDHENKVAELGLNEVIRMDYEDDAPCHPEVFFPKKIGTAPVYVQDENFREPCTGEPIYIKSCGEGKGPNRGSGLYEFELVRPILEQECEKGNYVYINGYYIPLTDYQKHIVGNHASYVPKVKNTRPIFQDWVGCLNYMQEETKCQFIAEILSE